MILCHISMKEEAENFVSHYQFFSTDHRGQMSQFSYCSENKCVIEAPDDLDDLSIDSN